MNERARTAMTADEVAAMLAAGRKVALATLNPDGSVHLVTMYYALLAGRIAFWTYRSSQKARNLARDPRVTCLVESGEEYFDLRGVQIRGVVEPLDDVLAVGRAVAGGVAGVPAEAVDDYVAHAARKRVAFTVKPERVVSWDHRKLLTSSRP
jgi:PPOX class probable F420-dependent enzyme